MNELEKEIGCQLTPFIVSDKDSEGSAFKKGADFILSKNLPVLFAEYMAEQIKLGLRFNKKSGTWYFKGPQAAVCRDDQTTQQIYDNWINNIYGK